MIKDTLNNAKRYYGLSNNIAKAFDWLLKTELQSLKEGRYEINDSIYANVQNYETKDDGLYEAHRKYIDIQCVVKGQEKVEVVNYDKCTVVTEYNAEKDVEFLNSDEGDSIKLQEGDFLIFYPQDAHKPCLNFNRKESVKKIVVKVLI